MTVFKRDCHLNIYNMKNIDIELFEKTISESFTMAQAARSLDIKYSTFKRLAIKLGLYEPNQGRKGIKRELYEDKRIPIEDILSGKYPFYPTGFLKKRLIKEKVKENRCDECGISEWNGKPIVCHLDHIDGDSKNHKENNLRMMCPNCHSQTETYAGRNKRVGYNRYEFIKAVESSKRFSEVKKKLNLSPTGGNNNTIRKLMDQLGLEFMK